MYTGESVGVNCVKDLMGEGGWGLDESLVLSSGRRRHFEEGVDSSLVNE